MKGINFKVWQKGNNISDVYGDIINLLYSNNYNVLNLLIKYNNEIEYSKKHGPRGLLGLGSAEEYARIEHKFASDDRNEYLYNVIEGVKNTEKHITHDYFECRKMFCLVYTSVYGDDKSFNECFDGLLIQDERFSNDINNLFSGKINGEEAALIQSLVEFYETYYSKTFSFFKFCTIKGLVEALESDFTDSGYKTADFQKPKKDVALISKAEIDELADIIKGLVSGNKSRLKSQIKNTKKVYRQTRKQRYYKTYFPELELENNQIKNIQIEKSGLMVIKDLIDVIVSRYDYANEFYNINKNRRVVDIFENVLSFGKRSPKLINEVYYHRAEMSILEQYARPFPELYQKVKVLLERAGGKGYHKTFGDPEDELKSQGISTGKTQVILMTEIPISSDEFETNQQQPGDE